MQSPRLKTDAPTQHTSAPTPRLTGALAHPDPRKLSHASPTRSLASGEKFSHPSTGFETLPLAESRASSHELTPADRKPLRRTPLKRSRWSSKAPTRSAIERELEAKLALGFWQETVRHPCRVCGSRFGLEAHHVIAKSVLKRELSSKGQPCPVGFIWDPRNGMSLCRVCHERYTNRALSIPLDLLTAAHWEFARDHGLEWRLERDYREAA